MPLVYAVNPWTRLVGSWAIKHAVSRSRAAVKWRSWAKNFASGLGKAYARAGAYLGAGAGAAYAASRVTKKMQTPSYKAGYASYGSRGSGYQSHTGRKRKRMESGSRKIVLDSGANYQQLDKTVDRFGSRLSKVERYMKLLGSHSQRWVERWQRCNAGTANNGAFVLSHCAGDAGSTFYRYPVYLWDLTCVNNQVNRPDTGALELCYPVVGRRLCQRNDTTNNRYNFFTESQLGRDSDDNADSAYWQLEETSTSVTSTGTRAMINWCDIRMLIYGATDRPSRVRVDLVQFEEDEACPLGSYFTAGGTNFVQNEEPDAVVVNSTEEKPWNDMWSNWTAPLVGNPITHRGSGKKHPIKVKYSKTFEFQPIDNGERDTRGHMREFHLRYNMDKVHSYTEGGEKEQANGIPDVLPEERYNPNEWSVMDRTLNSCFTAGRGRTYLVVSGVTMGRGAQPNGSIDIAPSFDLIIRRKRSQIHV